MSVTLLDVDIIMFSVSYVILCRYWTACLALRCHAYIFQHVFSNIEP